MEVMIGLRRIVEVRAADLVASTSNLTSFPNGRGGKVPGYDLRIVYLTIQEIIYFSRMAIFMTRLEHIYYRPLEWYPPRFERKSSFQLVIASSSILVYRDLPWVLLEVIGCILVSEGSISCPRLRLAL